MLSLETEDIMPASLEERKEAREDGVVINPGWGPKEVLGDGKVSGIVFKKCTSVYDTEHRFNPQYDENELITLDADMVIFAIGQTVILKDLLKDTKVEFFTSSRVPSSPSMPLPLARRPQRVCTALCNTDT